MNAFPTQCDSCQGVLRISDDTRTLDCPVCGPRFHLRPPCPYTPEVIEEANRQIDLIEKTIPAGKPEARHALLWLLEERWLFTAGHQVTIQVGSTQHESPAQCDVCRKELTKGEDIFHVEVRDRWRNSATKLDVCQSHLDEHVREVNVDVLRNQSLAVARESDPSDPYIEAYKRILSSLLPKDFLSAEGFLKTPSGGSEEISIMSSPQKSLFENIFGSRESEDIPSASFEGAVIAKALAHNLEKAKSTLSADEYAIIRKELDEQIAWHGGHDFIDMRKSRHRGVLHHEAFHDIQGFLYDNHPEIMDKLLAGVEANKEAITKWYEDPRNTAYQGSGNYGPKDFFAERGHYTYLSALASVDAVMGKRLQEKDSKSWDKRLNPDDPVTSLLSRGIQELGKNETIPVLLSSSSEGNLTAAKILSDIFASAGLNQEFYKTMPKFASGGSVPVLSGIVPVLNWEFLAQHLQSLSVARDSPGDGGGAGGSPPAGPHE